MDRRLYQRFPNSQMIAKASTLGSRIICSLESQFGSKEEHERKRVFAIRGGQTTGQNVYASGPADTELDAGPSPEIIDISQGHPVDGKGLVLARIAWRTQMVFVP